MYYIFGILFLILVTYPSSPILFALLGAYPSLSYIFIVLILIFLLLFTTRKKIRVSKELRIIFILLGFSIVLNFGFAAIGTAIRDFLTLLVIYITLISLNKNQLCKLLQRYTYFQVFFIATAMASTLIFVSFDMPGWNVESLTYLSDDNPIIARQKSGDFDYFMPLYLSVVPIERDGLTRFPLMFTEPTYLWNYCLGLFIFQFYSRRNYLVILLLGSALVFSLSYFGLLVIIVMIIMISLDFLRNASKFSRFTFSFFLLVSLLILTWIHPNFFLDSLYLILPEQKFKQIDYYFSVVNIFNNLSIFGTDTVDEFRVYGATAILPRYGVLGFIVYISVLALILLKARSLYNLSIKRRFMKKSQNKGYYYAIIASTLYMIKTPIFIPFIPLLFLSAYEAHVRQIKMSILK